jgi:hypothetical protein
MRTDQAQDADMRYHCNHATRQCLHTQLITQRMTASVTRMHCHNLIGSARTFGSGTGSASSGAVVGAGGASSTPTATSRALHSAWIVRSWCMRSVGHARMANACIVTSCRMFKSASGGMVWSTNAHNRGRPPSWQSGSL